ncbi:MAG: tributyrin esterase [Planctomycetota bacterium]
MLAWNSDLTSESDSSQLDYDARVDLSESDPVGLRKAIHAIPVPESEDELANVRVTGIEGQHCALMRVEHPVKLVGEGDLGDYAFAHFARGEVVWTGDVGDGVGEGMCSGTIRVRGNAGCGAGTAMKGGTLAIYGSAGDRCGAGMLGGGIFVRGDVGDDVAVGALRGTLVLGGSAGKNLGNAISDVTIFVRGSVGKLADGVTEAPLRKREQVRLGLLLLNASIRGDANDFRRIIPVAKLKAEQQTAGELNPNWR